jgi:hypothetical protein
VDEKLVRHFTRKICDSPLYLKWIFSVPKNSLNTFSYVELSISIDGD